MTQIVGIQLWSQNYWTLFINYYKPYKSKGWSTNTPYRNIFALIAARRLFEVSTISNRDTEMLDHTDSNKSLTKGFYGRREVATNRVVGVKDVAVARGRGVGPATGRLQVVIVFIWRTVVIRGCIYNRISRANTPLPYVCHCRTWVITACTQRCSNHCTRSYRPRALDVHRILGCRD